MGNAGPSVKSADQYAKTERQRLYYSSQLADSYLTLPYSVALLVDTVGNKDYGAIAVWGRY
jgi:hypothetical protein